MKLAEKRVLVRALNVSAVVLPLLNLWSIALDKGLIRRDVSSRLSEVSFASVVLAVAVFCVLFLSQVKAALLRSWLLRCFGVAPVEQSCHNFVRDSGLFYPLMGVLSLPSVGRAVWHRPSVVFARIALLWNRRLLTYSQQSSAQRVEVFFPLQDNQRARVSGLVVFVHGGAWGFGCPFMYRMVALPFLQMNCAVANVGYRVYPEGDASTQVLDIELAATQIARSYPKLCRGHVCLIGHSSGAHLCLMTLVERARREIELARIGEEEVAAWKNSLLSFDAFVGISGPYNISHHFDFEAGRGVDQLSPMKAACGNSRQMFLRYSPAVQLADLASSCESPKEWQMLSSAFPSTTLVHGVNDDTVPCSSSEEAARALESVGITDCREIYIKDAGHEDTIMQVMLGGKVQDIITQWLSWK